MALWRRRNRRLARRRPIVGPAPGQREERRASGVDRNAGNTSPRTGRLIGAAGARPARAAARRRHLLLPLPLPVSLALHAALIAALVLLVRHATLPKPHVEPGIAVVFKNTGLTKSAKHNKAPKSKRKGPTSQAAPPPPPPPPKPKVATRQPVPKSMPAPQPLPKRPLPKTAPQKSASAPPPLPKRPKRVKPAPKAAPPLPKPPKPAPPKIAKVKPPPPPKVKAPKIHLPKPPPVAKAPPKPAPLPLPKPPPMGKVQPKPVPQAQPQVRLSVPSVASLMPKQHLSQFETPPKVQPQPKQAQPKPSQRFMVMNHRSYGSAVLSRPNRNFKHGMRLSLSQSELMHQGPSITFKGKAGADWKSAFSKWVNEHKYYPEGAADNNEQGSVTISMTVLPDGSVRDLHLVKGSGSPILNMAWLGLFQGVHVPKFPPGSKAKKEHVVATMHYILIH